MRIRKHPATVIATVALLVALGGGTAAYASGLINGSQIKNHSIATKKLTRGAIASLRGDVAYAHINPDGTFDAAHSKNVTAANMAEPDTGFFCFNGLSFTPKNAVVTEDYNGVANGQITDISVQVPATAGACGTAKQVMVFTGLVNPGIFTTGTNIGFYVSFN